MAETELSKASVGGVSYPFQDAAARKEIETLKKSVEELAGKEETDPTVPAWAKAASKPKYAASEVGADPAGSAADALESAEAYADQQGSAHNADAAAHGDIRLLVQGLADRLNALTDSDDATLDQLSEVVAYIKANRTLIDGVTTSKVNVADIVDNLTTNVSGKPLSAAQGVALKKLVDAIAVPTKVSALSNDAGYQTAEQVKGIVENALAADEDPIPDYWQAELDAAVAKIKALQDAGGMDCVTFPVLTDLHYPSNIAKRSPRLARYVMEGVNARHALCLGDVFTRGCMADRSAAEAHHGEIERFLAPLRERLIQTQGNHDGAYGTADWNGDGTTDYYLYNYTPEEMFSRVYRKVGENMAAFFDPSGSNAYYVDDVVGKVRYVMLNTHCTRWELDANGHAKYNNMHVFRYTQKQYDFLERFALDLPSKEWGVIVASHVPLDQSGQMPEGSVMRGVLNAFKNKSAYSGSYAGTGEALPAYTNLFDKTADGYKHGYRFSSSYAEQADANAIITNYIPVQAGQTLHIKGIATSVNGGTTYCRAAGYDENKNATQANSGMQLPTQAPAAFVSADYDPLVAVWPAMTGDGGQVSNAGVGMAYIRIGGYLTGSVDDVVITVEEDIKADGGAAYDTVSVDVDFSGARGELIAYFGGHVHKDIAADVGFPVIATRCDAHEENDATLSAERVRGTATEQSFDVFTVNRRTRTIYATKLGAGEDRIVQYTASVSGGSSSDAQLRWSVANVLMNCASSNAESTAENGAAYRATVTANPGCTNLAVTVIMGGRDVTSTAYAGGVVSIASVTGDVVVIAVATKVQTEQPSGYTNLYVASEATDGQRLNSSGTTSALAGAVTTGYIEAKRGQVLRIYGLDMSNTQSAKVTNFNHDKTFLGNYSWGAIPMARQDENGVYSWKLGIWNDLGEYNASFTESTVYIRVSGDGASSDDIVITLDEEIVFGDSGASGYTNLLPLAVGCDGKVFQDDAGAALGYADEYYLSGSGNNPFKNATYISSDTTFFVTGFIPYTMAQAEAGVPIYVKGCAIDTSNSHARMAGYNTYSDHSAYHDPVKFSTGHIAVEELGENYYRLTPGADFVSAMTATTVASAFEYVRMSFMGTGEGVIITVGEPIE